MDFEEPVLPVSILDTDLYKLTMQQAVSQHFPTLVAKYQFTNRRKAQKFSTQSFERVKAEIKRLDALRLTDAERQWLEAKCPWFSKEYLDYLAGFQFKTAQQIDIRFIPDAQNPELGDIEMDIVGPWRDTILYEVPLMSLISQAHFLVDDVKWDYVGQKQNAYEKGMRLFRAGCLVAEFGTRRRRTYFGHKLVMEGLVRAQKECQHRSDITGKLIGTSNVHFAHMFDLTPIGTIAHEWIMGVAAVQGYEGSNGLAMDKWDQTFPNGQLSIALTDTFSSKPFFQDLKQNVERAKRWRGLRQDSGDPKTFAKEARSVYQEMGIDPKSKTIVFSDGLDVDRAIDLNTFCKEIGLGCSFGIGTNLSNDFKRIDSPQKQSSDQVGEGPVPDASLPNSQALNMVIKLWWLNDKPCVKISDELTKTSGDAQAVRLVKERFGLE